MGASTAARVPVDRASPADLMQLATDVGPAPMNVGAVLILATGPGFNVQEAQRLLGERARAVPRLRQRLCRALWSTTFVTGLADGGTGLVIVMAMNHVLADGRHRRARGPGQAGR